MRNLLLLFVIALLAYQIDSAKAVEPPATQEQEIAKLIKQLGSHDSKQSAAAFKKLVEIGAPAKPQLEASLEHNLTKIRQRAELVLAAIRRRSAAARQDNPANYLPACWKTYREIVGDNQATRLLFVDMYKAAPDLLRTYEKAVESGYKEAVPRLEELCSFQFDKRAEEFMPRLALALHPSDAAILLVLGDDKVEVPVSSHLIEHWARAIPKARPINTSPQKAAPNSPEFIYRKLFIRWLVNPPGDHLLTESLKLLAAAESGGFDEEVGTLATLIFRKKGLGNWNQDWDIGEAIVIMGLASTRNRKHIALITPFLTNQHSRPDRIKNRINVQFRDVALRALLHLTNQDPADYGFCDETGHLNAAGLKSGSVIHTCYFEKSSDRQKALAKWNAWTKENLKPEAKGGRSTAARSCRCYGLNILRRTLLGGRLRGCRCGGGGRWRRAECGALG